MPFWCPRPIFMNVSDLGDIILTMRVDHQHSQVLVAGAKRFLTRENKKVLWEGITLYNVSRAWGNEFLCTGGGWTSQRR